MCRCVRERSVWAISSVRQPKGGSVTISTRSLLQCEGLTSDQSHIPVSHLLVASHKLLKRFSTVEKVIVAHVVEAKLLRTEVTAKAFIEIEQETFHILLALQMEV